MKDVVTYSDFSELDMRVGVVTAAKRVEGSDKLLHLTVDIGNEERSIVAGIGRVYEAEELLDSRIVILANLEPREIMGHTSEGMLLAADTDAGPSFLTTNRDAAPGTSIA